MAGTISAAQPFLAAVVGQLRWRLLGAAATSALLALTEGAGVVLLIPLLHSIGLTTDDRAAGSVASAVSRALAVVNLQPTLGSIVGIFLLVTLARAAVDRVQLTLQPALQARFAAGLRERLHAALVRSEWAFFVSRRRTDLLHVMFREVDRAGASAYHVLALLTAVAVCLAYGVVAFRLSPILTMLVAAVGAAALWVMQRTNRAQDLGRRRADADRGEFRRAAQSLSGLKVAKVFHAEKRDLQTFGGQMHARALAHIELNQSLARTKTGVDVGSALLISSLLVAAGWLDLRGTGLLVLIFVFMRLMPRLKALLHSAHTIAAGLPSFDTVMRLIADAEARAEHPDTTTRRVTCRVGVSFDDVSFTYEGATAPALRNVSLLIPSGVVTAIVGASGAGKSTLADVLIGLLRPSQGQMQIDGRALADSDISAWRASIGYVPQDGFFLHGTIRANLEWAVPAATETQMWAVLSRAAAADFVRARPAGLDSVIGDGGVQLSGGERQRLALARALLADPRLLVLDEATSALDAANEQQILASLAALGHVTTVIITHRLSAVRSADLIHVLESGRIVESGTWEDLSARGGAFTRLLRDQPATVSPAVPLSLAASH